MSEVQWTQYQEEAGATFVPYAGTGASGVAMVDTFGEYEAEYAAIRKGVGIMHLPHRAVVEVRGKDRLDFLHRMLTQDIRALEPGQSARAFLLGNTGRIEADLHVLSLDDRTYLETDVYAAGELPAKLDKFLFTEDVQLRDVSPQYVRLALLGPAAGKLWQQIAGVDLAGMEPGEHRLCAWPPTAVLAWRLDETGSLGLQLIVPAEHALGLYQKLASEVGGLTPDVDPATGVGPRRPIVGRGVGWLAYNTTRIEAGTPLFHLDFGPDSLPHETALVPQTVSFTKGCYRGQEIVARMQHLGHPKKLLVGLKLKDDRQPVTGAPVMDVAAEPAEASAKAVVGAVTSSTVSPMLGSTAVALAMVKWGRHTPGTVVQVAAEGSKVPATVQSLRFLP